MILTLGGYVVQIAAWIGAVVITAICSLKRRFRWPFAWVLVSLFAPVTAIIAVQHTRLKTPSVAGWIVRVVIGVIVSATLVLVTETEGMKSPTVIAVKGHLVGLCSDEPITVNGVLISSPSFSATRLRTFSNVSFTSAAIAVWFGLLHYRSFVEKSLCFALVAFVAALAIDSAMLANYLHEHPKFDVPMDWGALTTRAMIYPSVALLLSSILWAWLEARAGETSTATSLQQLIVE